MLELSTVRMAMCMTYEKESTKKNDKCSRKCGRGFTAKYTNAENIEAQTYTAYLEREMNK